jgi:hypothetical protein
MHIERKTGILILETRSSNKIVILVAKNVYIEVKKAFSASSNNINV